MRAAILDRESRRDYRKNNLISSEINQIKELIDKANEASGLNFEFLEDGSEAFKGPKAAIFSNVKSMILCKGDPSIDNFEEKIGYYGEDMVLDITDMKLGTCWVAGTYYPERIEVPAGEKLVGVITVGKVDKPSIKEKAIRKALHKNDKLLQERINTNCDMIDWAYIGGNAVIIAPNAANRQRVQMNFIDSDIYLSVPGDAQYDMVDLGIAKRHFEIASGGKFPFGNNAMLDHSNTREIYRVTDW